MIDSTPSKEQYDGNGVTVAFPFGFKVWENSQVKVYLLKADGTTVTWAEDADYTLVLSSKQGGTVTAMVAPAAGETLTVARVLEIEQKIIELIKSGQFDVELITKAMDFAIAVSQQLQEQLDRSLLYSITTDPADVKNVSLLIEQIEGSVADAEAAKAAAEAAETAAEAAEVGALAAKVAAEVAQAAAEAAAAGVDLPSIVAGDAGKLLVVKSSEDGYELLTSTGAGLASTSYAKKMAYWLS